MLALGAGPANSRRHRGHSIVAPTPGARARHARLAVVCVSLTEQLFTYVPRRGVPRIPLFLSKIGITAK